MFGKPQEHFKPIPGNLRYPEALFLEHAHLWACARGAKPSEIENNGLHQRIPSVILHYPTKFGDSSSNIKLSVAFR